MGNRLPSRSRPLLLVGFLGLATMGISTFALLAEQSHLLAAGTSAEDRVEAFAAGRRDVGLATTTQRWFVIDCRNATIFAHVEPAAAEFRDDVARTCLDGALEIVDSTPASSFAWFGAAHAALALGDWEAMNTYLAHSYVTGAEEGWIARYRVELVADNYERVSKDNRAHFSTDLALLAGNMPAFGGFLAERYVSDPSLRSVMTASIETSSPNDQRIFLRLVTLLTTTPEQP
jgi:hypothetical protein